MPTYRVGRQFVVESGHMLSRHPERCRFPHGHTRTVEVVVSGKELDENGMLVDFKALKLALGPEIERLDHRLAIREDDPLLPALRSLYGEEATLVLDQEPTTEVLARRLFDHAQTILAEGFAHGPYQIPPGRLRLERLRVTETPTTWAEVAV